jgi:ankyrin repeat protein
MIFGMCRKPSIVSILAAVVVLLAAGATVALVLLETLAKSRHPPLPSLNRVDTASEAEQAIARGENPSFADRYGRTPLHRAASFGLVDVAEVLLKHGAAVGARTVDGTTPLHAACSREYPDPDEGLTSSAYQREKPRLATARLLVRHGADVNATNAQGATPLFEAVGGASGPDLVRFLIDAGADVKVVDADRNTPLYRAVHSGADPAVVRLLLERGADPNVKEKWFAETPLHVAAARGDVELIRLLLAAGADTNAKDRDGRTPVGRATDPAIRSLLSAPRATNP